MHHLAAIPNVCCNKFSSLLFIVLRVHSVLSDNLSSLLCVLDFLAEADMPESWYNIQADLPKPLPPVLHPGTMKVHS